MTSSSILAATVDLQVEYANRLIESDFESLDNRVQAYSELFAQVTVRPLGEFCRRFVWARNHTRANEGDYPSGFQVSVSPFAPVLPRPFHPTAMYNGILCFPLAEGQFTTLSRKTKKKIDLAYLMDPKLGIDKKLASLFPGEPATDDNDNFAGIFYDTEGIEMRFYVVVQANDEALSRELYQMVRDAEPESLARVRDCAEVRMADSHAKKLIHERRVQQHNTAALDEEDRKVLNEVERMKRERRIDPDNPPYVTWKNLFIDNPRVYEIEKAQERYRARIACEILKMAAVGPTSEDATDDADVIDFILRNKKTVKTTFNYVRQVKVDNPLSDVVYLSRLTSAQDVTSAGVVIRTSAKTGINLFLSPGAIGETRLTNGEEIGTAFVGIPLSTGPIACGALAQGRAVERSSVTSWSATEDTEHALIGESNYRSRDSPDWQDWERKCGLARPALRLLPAKVCVANPRKPPPPHLESVYNTTI